MWITLTLRQLPTSISQFPLPSTPAVCSTNESAKDGYIKDSLSLRLSVSAALGNDFFSWKNSLPSTNQSPWYIYGKGFRNFPTETLLTQRSKAPLDKSIWPLVTHCNAKPFEEEEESQELRDVDGQSYRITVSSTLSTDVIFTVWNEESPSTIQNVLECATRMPLRS